MSGTTAGSLKPIGNNSQEIAQGILQRFPITASLPDQNVTSGHSFDVGAPERNGIPGFKLSLNKTATPDQIGRFDANIHVQSHEALAGFKGCMEYRFEDGQGNVVYAELSPAYGVNGTTIPGAPDDRTDTHTGTIPLEVLAAVEKVELLARRCEDRGPLEDTVRQFKEGSKVVADAIKSIGADIAEIAAVIKGAG